MSNNVLTFVIVGHDDHPIFESDLAPKADGREVGADLAIIGCFTVSPVISEAHSQIAPRHRACTSTNLCCMPL